MKRDPLLWVGAGYLVLLVLMAIFVPIFGHPYDRPLDRPFMPPSGEFWLGTDEQGRDLFARIARGARTSLYIGLTVQAISLAVGIFVGVLGIYAPRWIATPLMRLTDAMFAFPDILLAILIIGLWQAGALPVIAALSITAWPGVARLVRTQVASLKDREFVIASKAMGASTLFVVVKHVLPQLWGILLAVAMVELAGTILAESTLSFLGIGILPPEPSLGNMLQAGRHVMRDQPQMLYYPALFLSLTIFALNFVGDGVRAAIDPKSKGMAPGGVTLFSRLRARLLRNKEQQIEGSRP